MIQNKYECSMDQELPILLHMWQADASCALTKWQHFSTQNDLMAIILKV